MPTALVSSCLLGLSTRYDGGNNYRQAVIDYLKARRLTPIPVCPEQLSGLPTPRAKCWFTAGCGESLLNGKATLVDETGQEVTATFLKGAEQSLKLAQLTDCKIAILKERSPSCGCHSIYRNGKIVKGMGTTAALLKKNKLQVLSEEQLSLN